MFLIHFNKKHQIKRKFQDEYLFSNGTTYENPFHIKYIMLRLVKVNVELIKGFSCSCIYLKRE